MSQLRQSPGATPGRQVGADQRIEPRHAISAERGWSAQLTWGAGFPLNAQVRDLSYRGMGLVTNEALLVGIELDVDLTDRHQLPVTRKRLRIVHCTPLPSGGFRVGCQFLTPLTYQQLGRLLH